MTFPSGNTNKEINPEQYDAGFKRWTPIAQCRKCKASTFMSEYDDPCIPPGWVAIPMPDHLDEYECPNHAS